MTRRDDGSVTVEAALGLAGLTVVTVLLLAALTSLMAQLSCTDAAREAARLVARGQPHEAEAAVHQIAPPGATLEVQHSDGEITVSVAANPADCLLPAINPRATAYALAEPGTEAADAPG
ncbi:TadE family type IV pilus minor pilin [Amycolatopsis sp., V23-08]|uniref:TadE family type IV pilus minor pilin n=1 Tax=Amycolatopsis heterodermiae TaxID=3110235 RepID=A0ABU5QZ98_9PSEU|nr:TadE family type IV pilus minor pilin [Amycolatopsis sp., V23-08]MEA5359265.1 TadE family type IV pilus minor pilin [Amycolatopsis sp., V23-08]